MMFVVCSETFRNNLATAHDCKATRMATAGPAAEGPRHGPAAPAALLPGLCCSTSSVAQDTRA